MFPAFLREIFRPTPEDDDDAPANDDDAPAHEDDAPAYDDDTPADELVVEGAPAEFESASADVGDGSSGSSWTTMVGVGRLIARAGPASFSMTSALWTLLRGPAKRLPARRFFIGAFSLPARDSATKSASVGPQFT